MLRMMIAIGWMGLAVCGVAGMAGCNSTGEVVNPFEKPKPFVATVVPADFVIVVDENHDTYYVRQHIQQVITAADASSRTTYTSYRDANNSVAGKFTQETPLTASQLQMMWNDVEKYRLLKGASVWASWRSDADLYKRNTYTIQIRANGMERTYHQTNEFSGVLMPLMNEVGAVRLPVSRDRNTPVVGGEGAASEPATRR